MMIFYYKMRQYCYKMRQLLYYKMRQILLTNASGFLLQNVTGLLHFATDTTKCVNFIRKCDSYGKLRRLIQKGVGTEGNF